METEPTPIKLKEKYRVIFKPKFGGRKRKTGNSGGVGRRAKALKRATVVSSRMSTSDKGKRNQYGRWVEAGCPGVC